MKEKCIELSPLLGRILIGGMFLLAGIQKIMNFEGTVGFIASVGLPAPMLAAMIAVLIEVGGGLSLILDWKTRWGAKALLLFTAVATAIFHSDVSDQTQKLLLARNLGIMGGLLYIIGFGAGKYSKDERG